MYAELSSRLPVNGSAFAFTYATVGEFPAWLVGWNLNLRYGVSSSGLARGMASYFVGLIARFGFSIPTWLTKTTILGIKNCCPLAPLFILILAAIQCMGTKESHLFNLIFTFAKLLTLSFIIICAFMNFDSTNMTPFLNQEYGFNGTLISASIIFYGYLGFDVITTISEEAINPQKDVPAAVK